MAAVARHEPLASTSYGLEPARAGRFNQGPAGESKMESGRHVIEHRQGGSGTGGRNGSSTRYSRSHFGEAILQWGKVSWD